jgi:hypothetical protein
MDDRDYRSGSLNKEKKSNRGLWLGMLAVALILAIAFFSFDRPLRESGVSTDNTVSTPGSPADVEPADGNTNSPATDDSTATHEAVPGGTSTQGITVYATEAECSSATGKTCNYVSCDTVTEGTQPDASCKQGWQPAVPAPDQTNVPETVSPPVNGTEPTPTPQTAP